MFVGPALILLNKFILQNLHFPYPMFLSALGVMVSALVARVLVMLGVVKLQRKEQIEGMLWVKRVLPVGLAHAGTLCLGNSAYLYLDVGFIQMLKSFTPVIILLCSASASLEYPNMVTILAAYNYLLLLCDHLHFCTDDKHRWNRNYAIFRAQRGHPPLDDPIFVAKSKIWR